jgi:hypothetical protein
VAVEVVPSVQVVVAAGAAVSAAPAGIPSVNTIKSTAGIPARFVFFMKTPWFVSNPALN